MRRIFTAIAIAITAALPVAAQQANLGGTWKLNLASSFMGGSHPSPDYELTKVLVQEGQTIHQTDIARHVSVVNIPLPDTNTKTDLTIDGKEHDVQSAPAFPGMPPANLKVTAEWQGNTLLVMERSAAGRPASTKRRYFLSEDGAHLIELVESHNGFGDSEQRLVFDK